MVKFMGVVRLKPGYDPDETWELWRTEHATNFKNLARPELKQYTINRVIKRLSDNDIYGISEAVFENGEIKLLDVAPGTRKPNVITPAADNQE